MKEFNRTLKNIDQFKTFKNLHMSRWSPSQKKNLTVEQMGSKVGGFFTILLYLGIFFYFDYLTLRMYNG